MRAANVGGRLYSVKTGHYEGHTYIMASKRMIREAIRDGSIKKIIGAGRITINELRRYAGLKPETIKRCPCCGQVLKKDKKP